MPDASVKFDRCSAGRLEVLPVISSNRSARFCILHVIYYFTAMYRKISVIGGSIASSEEFSFAYELGKVLADNGFTIVCGGGSGVMEAACKGCSDAGGLAVGILPGEDEGEANSFVSLALPTGMGVSRNRIIALSGEVVCAVGGAYGTLSEIAFALQAGKPVCGYGNWDAIPGLHPVSTPTEAVEFVLEKTEAD